MNDQSWKWHLPILPDSPSAISSPASVDGLSPPGSPDGPTNGNSGPAPRRASRSRSQAKAKPRLTIGTCGPTCFDSPVPDGPLSSWESRLRRRLARTGSTECSLTWKGSATPAARPLSRLVPSMRPTDGIDSGLWRKPNTVDAAGGTRRDPQAGQVQLCHQVKMACWPTPVVTDSIGARNATSTRNNPDSMHHAGTTLTDAAWFAEGIAAPGQAHRGSRATTEKPGALNPQFVCWLMGFPPEWDACAPTAMPSSRKSPRK